MNLASNLFKINKIRLIALYRSSAYTTNDTDLLMKSKIPMDYFQSCLYDLPIPKLSNTLSHYELSQAAILAEQSMVQTRKHIQSFLSNDGELLQSQLLKFAKDNKQSNYVNILWTDMYLRDRRPVVLTHNPTMVLKNPKRGTSKVAQDIRAANIVYSTIRYLRSLRQNLLEPYIYHMNPKQSDTERFRKIIRLLPPKLAYFYAYFNKAYALDMNQFYSLFNCSRIPQAEKDFTYKSDRANHLLVIHKSQMYYFDVMTSDGRAISPQQLLSNIRFILSQPSSGSYQEPGLGLFTSTRRDKWFSIRQELLQLGNEDALNKIDSAIFALALDSRSYDNESELVENTLHGPAENRWFDKSMSLIVDSKGEAALTFEHSWGDGLSVVHFLEEMFNDSENNPQFPQQLSQSELSYLPPPQVSRIDIRLNKHISDDVLPSIKKEYDTWRNQLDIKFSIYDGMTEKDVLSAGIGTDALLQLSFQMAYFRLNGKQAPTYESCSMSAFKHGRTETIRPATLETKAFCELSSKDSASKSDLYELLLKCSKRHRDITKQCIIGEGWDRHLFGLNYIAKQSGKVPDIFADPSYSYINDIIISTSTVPAKSLEMGGFAAVSKDGYGIGYGFRESGCGTITTSWKDSTKANGSDYSMAIEDSLKKLHKIVSYGKEFVKKKD